MVMICVLCFLSFISAAQEFSSYQSDGILVVASSSGRAFGLRFGGNAHQQSSKTDEPKTSPLHRSGSYAT
jgi:hypothetical protein